MKIFTATTKVLILTFAISIGLLSAQTNVQSYPSSCNASPEVLTINQPDGTVLSIVGKGNMNNSWTETTDGYTIVKNSAGVFEYANKVNGALTPSGVKANDSRSRTILEKSYLVGTSKSIKPAMSPLKGSILNQVNAHLQNKTYPTTGNVKILALLIDYPDLQNTYSKATFDSLLYGNNYRSGDGSFKAFYETSSGGQLTVDIDVKGWYRAANNYQYYAADSGYDRAADLVREAVDAAEVAGTNFGVYDNNSDGSVDGVLAVHAGPGAESGSLTGQYIWSHRWVLSGGSSGSVFYDGVRINDYMINPETRGTITNPRTVGIGVFCHEFGHNLGLPDLYDTDNTNGDSEGIGEWGLMASAGYLGGEHRPGNFSAWCKEELQWDTPQIATIGNTGLYSLNPASTSRNEILRVNTSVSNEYFLIENRQRLGKDSDLNGSGLAIWHINTNKTNSIRNNVNADETLKGVDLEEADGNDDLDNDVNRGDGGDLFPGTSNATSFTDATSPNAQTYTLANTGLEIRNIVETVGGPITFSFGPAPGAPCAASTNLTANTGSFDDGSGAGLDYVNNQSCSWLIQPSTAGTITLSFSAFRTEAVNDSVTIYDGPNNASTILGSFSGTTIPSSVTSTNNVMYVEFNSNATISDSGFVANYITNAAPVPCSGLTTLTAANGSFTDGSGAGNYTNNQNCSWLIQPAGAATITFGLNSLATEISNDLITIYDGVNNSAPILGSYSGTNNLNTLTSSGGSIFVEFTTNGSVVDQGFDAFYTSSTSSAGCSGATTFTATSGAFSDGSMANNYNNNQFCSWLIQPPSGTIDLSFSAFATESGSDRVLVFDGPNSSAPQIGNFSGNSIPATLTSTSNSLYIEFRTNGTITDAGWDASYTTITPMAACSGTTTITTNTGTFNDGSAVAANYSDNSNCSWLIQPSSTGVLINLNFSRFATESTNDVVTVYDGATTSDPVLATLSGTNPVFPNILSTGGSMLVTFTSNGSIQNTGWEANFTTQSIPPCSATPTVFNASTGTFNDGSAALSNYLDNQNCQWLIQPTGANIIRLSFNRFLTEQGFDFVTVYDGATTSATQIGRYSGNNIPSAITSSGGDLLVIFTTDGSVTTTGFEASYVSSSNQCFPNATYTAATGAIEDGSGTMNYQNNLNCSWTIAPFRAASVTATFNSFNVSAADTLYIYDGTSSTAPLINKYSGANLPPNVVANSGAMHVEFVTDGSTVNSGWDFNYTSFIPLSCSGLTTLTAGSGTFEDGSLIGNYDNNLNCTWLIQPTGNPAVITFNMNRMNLANFGDRVRVYDGTNSGGTQIANYFGNNIGVTVSAYSGAMFIEFTTDGSGTAQGWEGTYASSSTYCVPQTTFTANNGNFTDGSPFGQNYLDNTDCSWLIQPTTANLAVNLQLFQFDTEAVNDTLTVYDGATTTSPILATISGNNPTIPTLLSSGGSMLVTFKTNGSTTATGWRAFYNTQQIPGCSGTTNLTAATGTFDDGTLPLDNYAPNLNCSWLIQPAGASLVSLSFNRFATQSQFDFVTVYDGASNTAPIIGTYSGTTLPPTINSSGASLFVEFTTNNFLDDTGWEASYTSTNSQCFTNQTLTSYTGTVVDGSGATNYQDGLGCSWLIQPPLATSITASFNNFDVSSPGDTLYFYDGNSNAATLLGAFTGTTLPANITSTAGEMFVEFVTDNSTNAAGWEFDYTTTLSVSCAGTTTFNAPTMTFSDGSAATANYDNNLNCSWLIQPTGNPAVITFSMNRISLLDFGDRVRVYDGTSNSGTFIGQYFFTNLGTTVNAYSGSMFIEFVSDGTGNSTGWEGTYSSSSTYCVPNTTLTGNFGNFDDGSPFGQNYLDNTNCEWLIQPTATNVAVLLRFFQFDTELTSDTVTVYDGATTSDPILGTFSGSTIPPNLTSSGGSMLVTFKTNGSVTAGGWNANYSTQAIPYCAGNTSLTAANGTFDDGSGAFQNYIDNSNCSWTIQPPGALNVDLSFIGFNVQNNDVVNVYDGANNSAPSLGSFTGNTIPATINGGGTLFVEFISDGFNNSAGWEASYVSFNSVTLDAGVDTVYINAGAGSTTSLNLVSNVTWTNTDNASWLVASPVNGSGNSTINLLAVQANIGPERAALLEISSTTTPDKDSVVVIQRTSGRFITANPDTLYFGSNAAPSQNVTLNTNVTWSLTPSMSWIMASPLTGSNNGTPTISVQNNTSNQIRTGFVVVSSNTVATNDTVWVVQDSAGATTPTLSVDPMSLSLAQPMGSTNMFTVNSTTSWQTTAGAAWITITNPANPADTGVVQITANTANNQLLPRGSFVAVQDVAGTLFDTVFVVQNGLQQILIGNPDTIVLGSFMGATGTLNIGATGTWTGVEGDAWFSMGQNTGTGIAMVTLTTNSANVSGGIKTSYVALEDAANNLRDTVVVLQDTNVIGLSASPDTIRIGAAGGNSSFGVSTNFSWVANPGATWITLTPASGNGSGTVSVAIAANSNTSERISFIEVDAISGAIYRDTVWVIQDANVLALEVTPDIVTLNFTSGSSANVSLTSNTTWTVTNPAAWLTVTPLNGMNDATIGITTNSDNLTGANRVATIIVDGVGAISKTITVTQVDGSVPQFDVSTDTVYIANPQGSTGTFDIVSNVNSWTVSENTSWLLINPTSGSLVQTVTSLVATRNVFGNTRYANVTASAQGFTDKTVVIAQIGATPQFTVAPDSIVIGAEASDFAEFNLSSNLTSWTISENAAWLSISPDAGSLSQRITATALQKNTTNAQRSTIATITAAPQVPLTIKIVQDTVRTIGINENNFESNFAVYPNPTNGYLTIEIGNDVNGKLVDAKMFNVVGEEIPIQINFAQSNKVFVDLSGHSNGMYFLRLNYGGEIYSKKITFFK